MVPLGRQGPGHLPAATVARLDLALRRRANGVLPGDHLTAGVGDGTELAQLRPYEAGDDVRRLDPAASARTGVPHVRLQVPERAITTWIVLDVSPSMAFGTQKRLKSDVAEGVVEAISRLSVRRGGRIALATAGCDRPRLVPPRGGRGALAVLKRIVSEGVAPDGAVPGFGLGDALDRVDRLATSRGVVVIVSDLRDDAASFARPLRRLAAKHTVVAVEVVDPLEGELPAAGHLVLVDPETGRTVEADTSSPQLRSAFAHAERTRRTAVAGALQHAGATHVVLRTDRDWLRDLGRSLA